MCSAMFRTWEVDFKSWLVSVDLFECDWHLTIQRKIEETKTTTTNEKVLSEREREWEKQKERKEERKSQ